MVSLCDVFVWQQRDEDHKQIAQLTYTNTEIGTKTQLHYDDV